MKTIAIISQKGGSGKTTLALHLGAAAVEAGKTAVIVDLDPQASATGWYMARGQHGHDDQPHVQATHPAQLKSVLEACAAQKVDFVFIDTAPQSDNIAVQAVELADLALITCKPSVMDLRAIQSTLRLTQIAGVSPHIVLMQIEPHGTRHKEAALTLKSLKVDVLPYGTGKRVAYMDSLIEGQTAIDFEPEGKAAHESRAIFGHVQKLLKKPQKRKAA